MKGLCPSIGQTLKWLNSAACSHKCSCPDPIISKKYVNNDERAMLLWSHQRNQLIISRTPMWNESNRLQGTAMPKNIIDRKGVCPCVKYTRWNAPIMSHALMWKRTSDILQGMDMAQKSVIDWEEYASTQWSSDNKTLWDGYAPV